MWNKIKKQLENSLCDSLKDRIGFIRSNYRMQDGIGSIYITVDGNEVYNMCTLKTEYHQLTDRVYSQVEFLQVANNYLNSPLEISLNSNNTIIKILVLLDSRTGKRTLKNMRTLIPNEEDIVAFFYKLRCDTDSALYKSEPHIG